MPRPERRDNNMKRVVAQTPYGKMVGEEENGIRCFRGVPYAAAPVGELRFRAPQWPERTEEEIPCLSYAPDCIQIPRYDRVPTPGRPLPKPSVTSEDCLRMNIQAPVRDAEQLFPVFVWLHGGDMLNRENRPSITGDAFVNRGIVFVTPVWRCGVFGNLGIEELREREEHGSTGAYGILDLIQCLRWIRENISAFGGDPGNVTIGGQSSGAMTVKALVAAPPAKGLFRRAIAQSGGGIWDVDGAISMERKDELSRECMRLAGVDVEELLTGDAREISEKLGRAMAAMEFEQTSLSKMFFKPSVDGYAIFADYGRELYDGMGGDVDVMCGTIREEWNNFVHQVPGGIEGYNQAFALAAALSWAVRNTELGKKPVYHYFFDHDLPGENPSPHHGSEMQYVFGMLDPAKRPWCQYDYLIENACVDYWTSFIRTGVPSSFGRAIWRPYQAEDPVSLHITNTGIRCESLGDEKRVAEATAFLLAHPGVLKDRFFKE